MPSLRRYRRRLRPRDFSGHRVYCVCALPPPPPIISPPSKAGKYIPRALTFHPRNIDWSPARRGNVAFARPLCECRAFTHAHSRARSQEREPCVQLSCPEDGVAALRSRARVYVRAPLRFPFPGADESKGPEGRFGRPRLQSASNRRTRRTLGRYARARPRCCCQARNA